MPETSYRKPYKTFDEQLDLIEARGIVVGDRQEAVKHLRRLGYYRLGAYWYPFRIRAANHREGIDIPDSRVQAGVVFTDIVRICDVDRLLRHTVLEAIEAVEIGVRVAVAYELGKHGALGYLDRASFGAGADNPSMLDPTKSGFDMFQEKHQRMLRASNEEFARHFREGYGGDCPIWAAIEMRDFGTLSRTVQMLKTEDREKIADGFGLTSPRRIANWLECLNDLRNACAHHSRLNRRHFPKNPSFPKSAQFPQFRHLSRSPDQFRHRLYPLVCVLAYLLDQMHAGDAWRIRMASVVSGAIRIPGLKLEDFGIPDGWSTELLWVTTAWRVQMYLLAHGRLMN